MRSCKHLVEAPAALMSPRSTHDEVQIAKMAHGA
jgi:hypothetical protein